ncbi:serine protease [Quaeritorhiza haematococci]|nr:serine protease [Quaeritorhiza haematococci]
MRLPILAFLGLLMPSAALAAPRPIPEGPPGAEIRNQFLVMFTSPPAPSGPSIASAGTESSEINPASIESAEQDFLATVLAESQGPSTLSTGSTDGSEKKGFVDKIALGDGGRVWFVEGPGDLPERINKNGQVAIVERNRVISLSNGKKPDGNWGLKKISQSGHYIFPSNGGRDVDVYVIDSGIDIFHPDFEGRARNGASFVDGGAHGDPNSHGTHVAGTIGSRRWGVAPNSNLIAVRVLNAAGTTTTDIVLRGISWSIEQHKAAPNRKSVINMSLGGKGRSEAFAAAVRAAADAGVYVVAAAGNDNEDACNTSPAFVPEAITVGATSHNDKLAGFSNWGTCVDIMAPGNEIQSTVPGGGAGRKSGTSMAAPHVAGVMALILGERNFVNVMEGIDYLKRIATRDAVRDNKRDTVNLLLFNGRHRACQGNPCNGLND